MATAGDNQDTGPEGLIIPEEDALPARAVPVTGRCRKTLMTMPRKRQPNRRGDAAAGHNAAAASSAPASNCGRDCRASPVRRETTVHADIGSVHPSGPVG